MNIAFSPVENDGNMAGLAATAVGSWVLTLALVIAVIWTVVMTIRNRRRLRAVEAQLARVGTAQRTEVSPSEPEASINN